MKAYLDSEDSFYSNRNIPINHEVMPKRNKKDYAGIGAIIFTFTVMSIVIALSIYTAYQTAYGQEWNTTQLMQNPQNRTKSEIDVLIMQQEQLNAKKESLKAMVDYCFQHIERPNPIQDLIDKGFASEEYRNITCKEIKLTYDLTQERLEQLHDKINEYWNR